MRRELTSLRTPTTRVSTPLRINVRESSIWQRSLETVVLCAIYGGMGWTMFTLTVWITLDRASATCFLSVSRLFEMSVKATHKGKDYTYAMTMSRLNKETPALTPAERSMPSSLPHQLNASMTTLRQAVTSASTEWGPIEPAADYHLLAAARIV